MNKKQILHLLIKPTHACNLRCKHCYHAEKGYDSEKLSLESIEKVLTLSAQEYLKVDIIWHGGEPMLMGIPFYRECLKIEEFLKEKYGTTFENSIQTNATLINEDWIKFWKESSFSASISYDGIFNNSLRTQTNKVENAINLMQDMDYRFGCICIITSENVMQMENIYKWFNLKSINCKFNPIFASGAAKENSEYLLDPIIYAQQVVKTFKTWLFDLSCRVSISCFEAYIHEAIGIGGRVCTNASCLYSWLCLDAFGDFYPCGKPHERDFCFTNIRVINRIEEIFNTPRYIKMTELMVNLRDNCIKNCDIVRYCQGGCPAERLYTQDENDSWICIATKEIWRNIELDIVKFIQDLYDGNDKIYNPILARRIKKLLKIC